jgi:hypothetical protein
LAKFLSVLFLLQRSPDGIRDLAAAVQAALESHQSSTPPHVLKAVQEDCVRLANFVCLFAWKLHLRNRRAALQQQPAHQQLAAAGFNGWDDDAAEADVQVVLIDPHPAVEQQQQQQHLELEAAAASQAGAGPAAQQQPAEMPQPYFAPQQQQQQQQQQPVQVSSVSSQTELGPSLAEVAELVSGLRGLMASANPSLKPCRATLNLLLHHINQQLAAWNLPAAVGVAAAGEAAGHGAAGEQAED